MKFLISFLCSLLIISTPTNLQSEFEEVIHNNYDKYFYHISEETSVGDIVIVIGSINDKIYISGFIYNNTGIKHYFKLSNGDIYKDSFYKVKVKENMKISIESEKGTFITYDIECDTLEELNTLDLIVGKGNNDFPKEKNRLDIIDIFVFGLFFFMGIIALLTIILLRLFHNKQGLFNEESRVYIENNNNNNNIIDVEIEPVEEKTKEELMQEAYDDYNNGKITENELNNRLRRIWWSEDD